LHVGGGHQQLPHSGLLAGEHGVAARKSGPRLTIFGR
jgi:hypothetical protein